MKKDGEILIIVSTVILTLMVAVSLFFIIRLIPLNLKENLQAAIDSIPPLEEDVGGEGQIIYYGFASISISMIIILTYLLAGFVVFLSIVGIIIGIVNRKTEKKGLRYYNYVLIGLMSFTCIASIVKMILWRCGY